MEKETKPSNGSLICTFVDCKFRNEEYQDVVGQITGIRSTNPIDCDWSECVFTGNPPESCECLLSEEKCPCGFRM